MCEGSVKSESGRRSDREGGSKHMGTILNLSKRQMYLLKVNSFVKIALWTKDFDAGLKMTLGA